jgi:hypothetical protein
VILFASMMTAIGNEVETLFMAALPPIVMVVGLMVVASLVIRFASKHLREGGEYDDNDYRT